MSIDILIPGLIAFVSLFALAKKCDVYAALIAGAENGLQILLHIVPALIILLTLVHMLRAAGLIDLLGQLLAPVCHLVGIPPETAPLFLVRPISGSAALAVGADLMATYGVDSEIGRTAAVMLGSTETTFYTISVYFGAAGIRKTRHAIPAGRLYFLCTHRPPVFLNLSLFAELTFSILALYTSSDFCYHIQ